MKNWKKAIAVGLIALHFPPLTGCMQTVTRYRTEQVPVPVTKYRMVEKPVQKEVEVPYREEAKIPQYKVTRKAKLSVPPGRLMTIAFLPLSSSTGNPSDGSEISELVKQAVQRNPESGKKFKIIGSSQVRNALGAGMDKISPDSIRMLSKTLGIETIITGHVKNLNEEAFSFRVEGISAQTMQMLFGEAVAGDRGTALELAANLFFDRKVQQGFKTEIVTKTRTEIRTVYELTKEEYQETELQDKQVAFKKKEIDWIKTFLLGGLFIIVALRPSDSTKK